MSLGDCCRAQSRCGRLRWSAAAWVGIFGLLSLVTGSTGMVAAMAVPCVIAMFGLVIGWEWRVVLAPWAEGHPRRRWPLLAVLTLHWAGWLLLTIVDTDATARGDGGHGPPATEPTLVSPLRYNWLGSMAIMGGLLWLYAMGRWLLLVGGPALAALAAAQRHKAPPASGETQGRREQPTVTQQPSSSLRARRQISAAICLLYVLLTAVAVAGGYDTPRIVRVVLPMAGLPECLSGYTVAMRTSAPPPVRDGRPSLRTQQRSPLLARQSRQLTTSARARSV